MNEITEGYVSRSWCVPCGWGRGCGGVGATLNCSFIVTLLRTFRAASVHTSRCPERRRRLTSDASRIFSLIAAAEHQRRVRISHLIATLSVRALASAYPIYTTFCPSLFCSAPQTSQFDAHLVCKPTLGSREFVVLVPVKYTCIHSLRRDIPVGHCS